MTVADLTLEDIRTRLAALKPELRARFGVTDIAVFGSRARGDHRPDSDVDLLVDVAETLSLFQLTELQWVLEACLGVNVDVVPRTSVDRRLKSRIEAEAVLM